MNSKKRLQSPAFVAKFADGEVTRMTTYCRPDKPDVGRGVRLSKWAYQSRTKREPPTIVEASFELNGKTLATYDAAALEKVGTP
jgi:hypothetical protein